MINDITVDTIVNYGTTIEIIGHDIETGVACVVGGDQQEMSAAIEGLGIAPGVEVGVFIGDDGDEHICAPDPASSSIAAGRKLAEEYGTDPDPDFDGLRRYNMLYEKLGRPPTLEEQRAARRE